MEEDIKEYIDILNKIKDNKKRLVDISLEIEKIVTKKIDISKINEYLNIFTLEKEAISLDETNRELEIKRMKKEVDYTFKYNEVITLEQNVISLDQTVTYPNDYHKYFNTCDDFLYNLKKLNIDKEDYNCIRDSINSNINRRIIYESFKDNKNIYYYLDERKKYQEQNNMI